MDESKSTNGAEISPTGSKENETKEKVDKTLLLKQQIEENRMKMLQRGKNISNSKNKLEDLFTQLDRSSQASSIISTTLITPSAVEDARDSKISSLETSITTLKAEKRDLELQILSLETVQENKDCLELELNDLRFRHENVLSEKGMLEARLQRLHELEDENDELKVKLDQSTAENTILKQDLNEKEAKIISMEEQVIELNHLLRDAADKNSEENASLIEELQLKVSDLDLANQKLKQECESLQSKNEVNNTSEIKIATLGTNKKSKAKKGKAAAQNNESASQDSLDSQLLLLTEQLRALEKENDALKSSYSGLEGNIKRLEDELLQNKTEKNTLQQRVDLLIMELNSENPDVSNDLSNLKTLLAEKENELSELSSKCQLFQTETEENNRRLAELDNELFKLRSKCRDSDYILSKKEEMIADLQQQLESQTALERDSIVAECEANFILQENTNSVMVAQLKEELDRIEKERHECLAEMEGKVAVFNEEKQKLAIECDSLKAKLDELSYGVGVSVPVPDPDPVPVPAPTSPVKIATLGAGKKSKSKRGKGSRNNQPETTPTETVEAEVTKTAEVIATQVQSLDSRILELEEQLANSEAEKSTLLQRVQLLLTELNTESAGYATNDVANMQIMLEMKEKECAELSSQMHKMHSEKEELSLHLEEANRELFKLRVAGRDAEYLMKVKEERIQELQSKLDSQDISSTSMEGEVHHLSKHISELQMKLSEKETLINQSLEEEEKTSNSIVALQEALKKARDDLQIAETEISNHSEIIQKLEKSCSSLSKENGDKNLEIQQLKDDLQEAEVVLAEEITKFKTLQDELNRMKMQAELDAKHEQLERELNHSQMEREILYNDLQTRSSQLEECKQYALQLESQLAEVRSKETELLQANETNATQLRSSEEKLERVSEKFKKLAVNYKQKLAIIQQLEHKLETLKQVGGSEDAAQTRLLQSQDEIKDLRDQLEKLKGSAEELNRVQLASVAYQNDLQSARAEIELFVSENRTLLEQLNHLQAEVDHLRQGASHSAIKLEEWSSMTERLQRELDASHDRLRTLSEKMVEEVAVKDVLGHQMEELSQRNVVLVNELDQLRMLSGKAAEEETVNNELKDELDQVRIQLEKANSLIEFRSNELSQFHQYLSQVTDEKENLFSQNQLLQQQLHDAFAGIESKTSLVAKLEEELAASQSHSTMNNSLADDLNQVRTELEVAKSLVESKMNEIAELCQKLDESSAEKEKILSASDTDAQSMKSRIAQLEEELAASTTHSMTNNSLTDELNQTKIQLENTNSLLDSKSKDIVEVQQQLSQVSIEKENILLQSSSLEARILQLEQELAVLHSRSSEVVDKSNTSERCQVLEQQVHELNIQYSALYASFSSQLHEYATLEQQKAEVEEQNKNLQMQLNESAAVLVNKEAEVEQQKAEIEERNKNLEIQLNQSTTILAEKQAEVEQQKAEMEERNKNLQMQLNESTAVLAEKQAEVEQQKAEMEGRCKDLQVQLNESTAVLAEKKTELEKLSTQLEEFKTMRNSWEAAEQELQQLRDGSNDRVTALLSEKQAELAELLAEKEKMAVDVKEIGLLRMNLADMMSEQDDLNYQIEDYQTQIQQLEGKMKESVEVRSILETTVSFLETKVGELQAEIAQLTSSKTELETLSSTLSLERDQLLARIAASELELEKAQSTQKEAEDTTNELRQQLDQSISDLEFAKAQFESTITALRQELEQSASDLLSTKAQYESETWELRQESEQFTSNLTSMKTLLELAVSERREIEDSYQLKMNEVADLLAEKNELQEQLSTSKDQVIQLKNLEASLAHWRLEQTHLPQPEHQDEPVLLSDYLKHLNELTTLCDTYKEEVGSVKKSMEEMQKQTEELSLLRVNLFDTIAERDDLESTVSALEDELVSLRSELKSKCEDTEAMQKCNELTDQVSTLNNDKELLSTEVERLLLSLADSEFRKSELNNSLEELQNKLSLLEDQSAEQLDIYQALQEKHHLSESELSQLRVAIADSESAKSELTASLEELQAKFNLLENQNAEQSNVYQTLQEKQSQLETLEVRCHQMEAEHKDLTTYLEESNAKLNLLESQSLDQSDLYRSLQEKHSHSESELSQLRVAILDLTTERDDLNDRVAHLETLEAQHLQMEARHQELTAHLEELKIKSDLLEKENAEQLDGRQSLQEKYSMAESELSQLRVAILDVTTERDDLNDRVAHLETLEAQHLQMEAQHQELTANLEELKTKSDLLEKDNVEQSNGRQSLQEKFSIAESELSQLRVAILDVTTERDDLSDRVAHLETLTARNTESQSELNQLEKDNVELMNSYQSLQEKYAISETELSQLRVAISKVTTERDDIKDRLAHLQTLEAQYLQMETEYKALQNESSSLQDQVKNSETSFELGQLRVALQDVTEERSELQDSLRDAEDELTTLRITISELSMERDEFSAHVQVLEDQLSQADEQKKQIAAMALDKEQKLERVSIERDELQQTVHSMHSRAEEFRPALPEGEEAQQETQGKESEEVNSLKQKIASLESEVHEAKIKVAKSLRQVKLLKAELAKQKEQSKDKATDDYFGSAIEEELRKQVSDAERVTAEKVKEIERLLIKIDTLEGASERFLQSKERQDNDMAMLQQRNQQLLSRISSLEWDNADTTSGSTEPVAAPAETGVNSTDRSEEISELETKLSQLADDNEHYQDVLEELKNEKQAAEAELRQHIQSLEVVLNEKNQLLDEMSQSVDNKDRLLSDAYDSVDQLRKQIVQLNSQLNSDGSDGGTLVEDLKRENGNLVDMIRQLSTTGTLDTATVQRLKDEIVQNGQNFPMNDSDVIEDVIDWQAAFNDIQIEVEYLRSQNAALLHKLQDVGVEWEEGMEQMEDGEDGRNSKLQLELDDAFRTIHEREMHCQELTWEIKKLLEERDTLQLRLSNALRLNHEMQQELKDLSATASGNSPIGDIAFKLRELKQLNYSLDVQLKREQEERQTIERQLMALYGTKLEFPFSNSRRTLPSRRDSESEKSHLELHHEQDLNNSGESLGTEQVLDEWLKGKGSAEVHHV